jgi:iron complex transport system ATP-binding protein
MKLAEARDVCFGYGTSPVLEGVSLAVSRGELVALLGPNGAGKTTCLHLLLGLATPDAGDVWLSERPVRGMRRTDIARLAAFVPQGSPSDFAFTVREVVAMGRTPHLGRYRSEGPDDARAIEAALEATETTALSERLVTELSGGERQRVHVARALAQETPLLLLDEPTANLDVEHQLQLLGLIRSLVDSGRAAMVALHDLSLAARYADRVVILAGGRLVADGAPSEVITAENLARYFRIVARIETGPEGRPLVVPLEPLEAPRSPASAWRAPGGESAVTEHARQGSRRR